MDTRLRESHYKKAIIGPENGKKIITVGRGSRGGISRSTQVTFLPGTATLFSMDKTVTKPKIPKTRGKDGSQDVES